MARNTRVVGKQIADAVAGGGLKKDASENLELNLKSNAGLNIDTDQLEVLLEASKGLSVGASGLAVDYDDSSIGIVTGKLAVKALGITNAMLAGSITYAKLSLSDGDIPETKLGVSQGALIVGDASGYGSELTLTSAQIVVGDASGYAVAVSVTGDVTISNAGVTTIGNDKVTNDMLANMTRGTVKVGGASDAPTDLNAKTDGYILIGDGTDINSVAVSGDITIANTGVTTIGAEKVVESMLDIHNAPAEGKILGYTANGLEWVDKEASDAITEGDIITGETPSGLINGANAEYTLANTPVAGTVRVYLNGLRQEEGSGKDYQISGDTITFETAPDTGDILLADYFIA
ncbi:MAG: hypothetical protein ACTSPD_09715 [Promethearchaeota archaeon]